MSSLVRWPLPRPAGFPAAGPPRLVTVPTYPGPIQRRPLAANTAFSSTTTSSLSVTPTGMVQDDWMLAFVASVGGANTLSSASGWTEVGTQVTQATTTTGSLWKKKAGAGEAGPYQWDGANARRMAIIVVAYLGADPTDLVDGSNVASAGATAQQFDHPTLTPGAARDWHILATCSNSAAPDDDAVTFTQPGGYAEQAEVSSEHATSANVHMALADRELLDTSATGVQSVTITGGVNRSLVGLEVVIRVPTAGGTTFPVSVAGAVSPSATLVREPRKILAGVNSSAGALAKQVAKTLTGAISPAGALVKQTGKAFGGAASPTGAVQVSRVVLLAVAGAVSPSGALVKQVGKALAGATTPAGTLIKQARKTLTGATTPAGALALIKVILRTFTGATSPTGALVRQPQKRLDGATSPTGSLVKQPAKRFTGATTPAGALTKTRLVALALAGAITPAATLRRLVGKALAGAVSPAGQPAKHATQRIAGQVTPTGTVALQFLPAITVGHWETGSGLVAVRDSSGAVTGNREVAAATVGAWEH